MLACLKIYTAMSWPLFPCSARTKKPITEHGFKDATTDWARIESWHKEHPGCAWGTPTSAERAVLDSDPRHNGHIHLARLEAEHGALPDTPKVLTGGGGWHHYLHCPPGTKCRSIAKSDRPEYADKPNKPDSITLKAEGGYVLVPPSRIAIPEHQGRDYGWKVRPWEGVPIAEAPAWLLGTKPTPKADVQGENPWVVLPADPDLPTHPGSPEGERRKTLCRLVGVHLARGDSEGTIYALAEAWAARCRPAFDEWRKHVDGLLRLDRAKGFTTSSPTEIPKVYNEEGLSSEGHEPSAEPDRPTLPAEARHGLFGEMLKAIEPETEADPAGVLLGWLACFGNVVGRGAWFRVGPRLHYPGLFVGVVGKTSDAKGDGWAVSLWPFRAVEAAWAKGCIANGVGSGEGLVEKVADEQKVLGKDGTAQAIPGASDKRCLLRLAELSKCFKLGRRENATLSEHLREAWEGDPIHVPNRKGNGLSASDYAISVVGDITPGVLGKLMASGTEGFDGWANRFLWAAVKRSRFLPSGGDIGVLKPYLERVASALAFAKQAGEVKRDAEAEALWREEYPSLATSGDSVPHTDRARPYVLRLSMIYALADCSAVIRREHLEAALALWSYCRASALYIFGGSQEAEPDPLWLRLLNAIGNDPGINRTGLREVAGHKTPAPVIAEALARLERNGLAHKRLVKPEGKGGVAECWYPGPKPDGDGGGDGESVADDNLPISQSSVAITGRAVGGSPSEKTTSGLSVREKTADPPTALPTSDATPSPSISPKEERGCHPPGRSRVLITDITPPPNAPLEAEGPQAQAEAEAKAEDDVALDDDDFLSAISQNDRPHVRPPPDTEEAARHEEASRRAWQEWQERKAKAKKPRKWGTLAELYGE